MDSVLIRYHEIALKKGNRAYFTEMLKRNVLAAVKDLGAKDIRSLPARLLLTFRNDVPRAELVARMRTVFGVANFSLVERTERDVDVLRRRILESMNGARFESFRIETQRSDKTFPLTSPEIDRQLGAAVKENPARGSISKTPNSPSQWKSCRMMLFLVSIKSPGRAACRWAPAAA